MHFPKTLESSTQTEECIIASRFAHSFMHVHNSFAYIKNINNHSLKISNNIHVGWGFTQININIHAEHTRQKLFLLKAQRKISVTSSKYIIISDDVFRRLKLQMLHARYVQ